MSNPHIAQATTDPALEFATLASALLAGARGDGGPAYDGLAKFVGIPANDPLFFEIIGMIGTRAVSLIDFIANLQDEHLDDDLREGLISGIKKITQIINPSQMGGQWSQVAANNIDQNSIRLLKGFSRTARDYRRLRVLNKDEKEKLIEAIDDALIEIRDDKHFPRWAMFQLDEGVRRLKLMILHFDFFGHDAVLDQLIKIQAETKYTFDFLGAMKAVSEHKLVKTVGLFALMANLLLLPPKIQEGIPYYRTHIHQISQEIPKLIGGPLKQITHQQSADNEKLKPESQSASSPQASEQE